MSEEFELCVLVFRETVELLEVRHDVSAAWEVEGDSGCCVLNGL